MKQLVPHADIYPWRDAPFIRLLLPFITGIIIQVNIGSSAAIIFAGLLLLGITCTIYELLPIAARYKLRMLPAVQLSLVLVALGSLATYAKDIRNSGEWFGNSYSDKDQLLVSIDEQLTEKTNSFKTIAVVEAVIHNDNIIPAKGKLLLYFSKDSLAAGLAYGASIIINKPLQPIKGSGNPGAFNYPRYAAFQQLYYNAFLKNGDFVVLPRQKKNAFKNWLFDLQESILITIQKNIQGKNETAIAEALLIGYKEDLDKNLVQAYSNTGVVHIIAISGLHLGLIYVMLTWIFNRLPFIKRSKLLKVIFILGSLWIFSLLSGASASVLRSAVMFSFIVLGQNIGKKTSIFNSLAVSAFLLLLINPFFLWDVGFQLSYLAVISIVVFQKPVYNWLYFKNKLLDKCCQMIAITIAAQVFTFPICIYYFHQFPNLFLFTNIIAVPLSSIILFAEILLIAVGWLAPVAFCLGWVISFCIWLMNKLVLFMDALPFAVWDGIHANVNSTVLLYATIISLALWLLKKNKAAFKCFLFMMMGFLLLNAGHQWQTGRQKKMIVYNVPKLSAIDLVAGRSWAFIGDTILLKDGLLQNFHLKPSRISLGLGNRVDTLDQALVKNDFILFEGKKILLVNKPVQYEAAKPVDVDIIIISGNPKLYIPQLAKAFNCEQYVFDASNPLWKIAKWKKDCEELHLRNHTVSEQGAFILDCGK